MDPVNFADPTGLMGERKCGKGPTGWGLKDGKWTFVEGMKKGDAAYKKGGYTDFAADNSVIESGSINGGSFAPVYLGSSQHDVSYAGRNYTEWSNIHGGNYDNPLEGYRAWQSYPGELKGEGIGIGCLGSWLPAVWKLEKILLVVETVQRV